VKNRDLKKTHLVWSSAETFENKKKESGLKTSDFNIY